MTRDQTKDILREIRYLYPETPVPKDPTMQVDLWTEALRDEDYATVHACLLSFVKTDTRGYAPKIGQILGMKPAPYDDRGLEDWGAWRSECE